MQKSASPELFFRLDGRIVTARPMKGTSPRGRWLEEVEALARWLGRRIETGSVTVPEVFSIERYRTVLQMTSTVTGRLPRGAGFSGFGSTTASGAGCR